MSTTEIDIDQIRPAQSDGLGIHQVGRIGNVPLQLRETIGGRSEQQDEMFTTPTKAKNTQQAAALLKSAFAEADAKTRDNESGSTATVAVITKDRHITIGHLGDSPAVLFVRHADQSVTAHPLIKLHKPDDPEEEARIKANGGYVGGWGGNRVNGRLAMSRAFGNKKLGAAVSKTPDITPVDLSRYVRPGEQAYLCVSCDGLYEGGIPEDHYAEIIRQALERGRSHETVEIMKNYAIQQGSEDNVSVVLAEIPDKLNASVVLGVCDGHGDDRNTAKQATHTLSLHLQTKQPPRIPNAAPAAATRPDLTSATSDGAEWGARVTQPNSTVPFANRWKQNHLKAWVISANSAAEAKQITDFAAEHDIGLIASRPNGSTLPTFMVTQNSETFAELLQAARSRAP